MLENRYLTIKNICKSFGRANNKVAALDNVKLEIKDGEFISLLGPSGCGKTTLLRIIAGFETPDSGDILFGKENILNIPSHKRPTNLVFQRYALFPHMTVYENIAFSQVIKKRPKQETEGKVKNMLRLVQLEGYETRKPGQLSGGQCQRVALARALINEPQVLLLDEPLGALDLKIRKQMQLELKNIQEKLKITFIYVTHDQEEALVMSDRIVLMQAGKIVQVDTPKNIYNQPRSKFAATFIGESNIFDGKIVKSDSDSLAIDLGGLSILADKPAGTTPEGKVSLAIRLEKIKIINEFKENRPLENQIKGKIVNVVFYGSIVRYHVKIADSINIQVEENVLEEESFNIDDTVTLGFSKNDVHVFSE